jgi:20S proteasome subunit alpha 5
MTLEEAETLALQVLKQVMEEKLNATNVEIAAVTTKTGQFRIYSREEVQAIITNRLDQQKTT